MGAGVNISFPAFIAATATCWFEVTVTPFRLKVPLTGTLSIRTAASD